MTKLQEKRNSLFAELSALIDTAETETRAFTDEESEKFDSLSKELSAIDKQIDREKEVRDLELGKPAADDKSPDEEQEKRAFELYLKSQVNGDKSLETRANMTYGDNGAVIPKTIVKKIIDKVINISPLFERATKYYLKGDISIPYVNTSSGDITVAFASEFSSLTASTVKISSVELKGFLAGALVVVSKKLVNNSQFDIVSFVIYRMAQKIAVFIENYLINGGASASLGGTSSGLKQSVTQSLSITAGGSLTADFLIDIQDTIPDVFQKNACWIMHPSTRTLIRKLKDGQNNYLLIKDFSSPTGYTLLGKPVYISDNMTAFASATAGKDFLYYGDFSGLAVKVSEEPNIEVLRETYAAQHGIGFVLWMEIDNIVEDTQKIVKGTVVAAG